MLVWSSHCVQSGLYAKLSVQYNILVIITASKKIILITSMLLKMKLLFFCLGNRNSYKKTTSKKTTTKRITHEKQLDKIKTKQCTHQRTFNLAKKCFTAGAALSVEYFKKITSKNE